MSYILSFTGIKCSLSVLVTVTLDSAVSPLTVVALITVVPLCIPLTVPLESTVATSLLSLVHVTVLFSAVSGSIVADKLTGSLDPVPRVISLLEIFIFFRNITF